MGLAKVQGTAFGLSIAHHERRQNDLKIQTVCALGRQAERRAFEDTF